MGAKKEASEHVTLFIHKCKFATRINVSLKVTTHLTTLSLPNKLQLIWLHKLKIFVLVEMWDSKPI